MSCLLQGCLSRLAFCSDSFLSFFFSLFFLFLFSPFFCRDMEVLAYHLSHGPIGPFPLAVG